MEASSPPKCVSSKRLLGFKRDDSEQYEILPVVSEVNLLLRYLCQNGLARHLAVIGLHQVLQLDDLVASVADSNNSVARASLHVVLAESTLMKM